MGVSKIYINKDFRIIIRAKLFKCIFEYHLQAYKLLATDDTPFVVKYNDIPKRIRGTEIRENVH